MSTNKHPGTKADRDAGLGADTPRPPSDLDRNPGIGSSKGVFGTGGDPKDLELDNTSEGDVANDLSRGNAVDPDHLGRTNK